MLSAIRRRLARWITGSLTSAHELRGIPVIVHNTRPDIDTSAVVSRLDAALALLERHQPANVRRMRRDFARIVVQRYPCRGAWLPAERSCVVELTFVVNPSFTLGQVASTILHEAMHARLDVMGVHLGPDDRAREERFCRRAEIELGMQLPDGAPIVERALGALAGTDDEVAPVIDWSLAARRVAAADIEALRAPAWLKETLARRAGVDREAPER